MLLANLQMFHRPTFSVFEYEKPVPSFKNLKSFKQNEHL